MRALVTGGAGFIGSSLAARLADEGNQVIIADSLSPYYDPAQKRANLAPLRPAGGQRGRGRPGARRPGPLLDDVDVVFHQAAQPGVRRSWDDFGGYATANITVTQRLLDASCAAAGSSVSSTPRARRCMATVPRGGSAESDRPQPFSPYGVTKLAAEHLCGAYAENFGVPTVSLRYFTVYGPRQRPDMAFHRLIEAARNGTPFPLYSDGRQVRDFTYVDDVVTANLAAVRADPPPGTVVNVAGGVRRRCVRWSSSSESWLVAPSSSTPSRRSGDVRATAGLTRLASQVLGWEPQTDLRTGVNRQVAWHAERAAVAYA